LCWETLAKLRNEKCKRSEEEIALALEGTWRPEHLFALKQAYELYHKKSTIRDKANNQ